MYGLFGTAVPDDSPNDDNAYTHLRVAFVEGAGSEPTTQIQINLRYPGEAGFNPSNAVAFGKVTSGNYETIQEFYSKYGSGVSIQRLISGGDQYVSAHFPHLPKITSLTVQATDY
jgi:hypothetical protein